MGKQPGIHKCPHPECRTEVSKLYFACATHWRRLPVELKEKIVTAETARELVKAAQEARVIWKGVKVVKTERNPQKKGFPPGPWPIAAGGRSCDAGSQRIRVEAGPHTEAIIKLVSKAPALLDSCKKLIETVEWLGPPPGYSMSDFKELKEAQTLLAEIEGGK